MGFLTGKRALIFGVASNRSIAWGIAKAMHREGADLAFAYMGERLRERVEKLAGECDSDIIVPCDVENDDEIEAVFDHLDDYWDSLDIIVHSVAFAPKEMLEGDYLDVLVTLVEAYERVHYPIDFPDPVEAIKFRMEQQGLTVEDLVPVIG